MSETCEGKQRYACRTSLPVSSMGGQYILNSYNLFIIHLQYVNLAFQ